MSESIYASMPESLTMREARVAGWTLASTRSTRSRNKRELFHCTASAGTSNLTYVRSRVMQMDLLRCKSPEMVERRSPPTWSVTTSSAP
ncbi:MAG: hypothetical protein IPK02_00265 [Candidatus Accumulibacter sp.]|uniref:Uncharacterized protein n=1 Tax=Candidatus Accumulibacter affinis TaxID=2954384 RepID=A0A935W675_9PROT|nr:hypothetical protein [Candidatus Accumulibacter affinis]